jgi:hypothetical protein
MKPMPRQSTLPTLYDECKTISISSLKKWGYLKPGEWKSGEITWSRNGVKTGRIGFTTDMFSESPHLELNYIYGDIPVNYKVPIVSIPSNMGKGSIWYFVCPVTGKRCRKLYSIGGKFLHREAFRGCFYEKQTYSHNNRSLCKKFEIFFGQDNAYEQMCSKYFKKYYAGKHTKRYMKLFKIIRKAKSISVNDIPI